MNDDGRWTIDKQMPSRPVERLFPLKPQHEILELTKALIRIPSVHSRPGEIGRCADFIEAWLTRRDIDYTRSDIADVPAITVLPRPGATEVLACRVKVIRDNREIPSALATDA